MGTMAEAERKVAANRFELPELIGCLVGQKDQSYHVDLRRERLGGIRTQICCRS